MLGKLDNQDRVFTGQANQHDKADLRENVDVAVRQIATPVSEPRMHIGTTRMTANGSAQLSYCAANTRNTKTTASGKIRLFQKFLAASIWM